MSGRPGTAPRRLLLAATLASVAGSALAQEAGVPASVVQLPSAAKAPRARLDEPSGPPKFAPNLPDGTPAAAEQRGAALPVTRFVDALSTAYWSQPRLLAERARLRATDYRLPQARAASGPAIRYEASRGYQRDNVEQATGGWSARSGWTSTASAILTQPLFTFGRNAAGEREALSQIAFQRASLRQTENETFLNAIAVYAGLLRDRSAVRIVREDLQLLQREYADNQARFTKREVTVTDVQQIETRLEQARAQLLGAQRNAASSEAAFLAAIGAPPGELAPPNPLRIPVDTLEEAYAFADTRSPVLGAAYARERISRAQRDAARAATLPRVDLRGRADYGSVSPYTDRERQTSLRGDVVVSGSLFESGLLRARVNEAEAANDADWRLIDAALRENRAEVADAWNEWVSQSASLQPLQAASEAARLALEGALLQERAGLRSTLDVLQLARELLLARSNYNAATAGAYVAQARLLAAMGALEHSNLMPDAPPYDPQEHFDRTKDDGMIPLIVPLLRRIDGLGGGGGRNRTVRDPAGPMAVPPAPIPPPELAEPVPAR